MPNIRPCLAALLTAIGVTTLTLSVPAAQAQRYEDDGPGPIGDRRPVDDGDEPPQAPPTGRDYDRGYDDRRTDVPREEGERYGDPGGRRPYEAAAGERLDGPEDVSAFFEPLSQFGQWDRHPVYGYVWVPDNVDEDWRPYTYGNWSYTGDFGWYWASEEPWGWATYHYGRWAYDGDRHWFWVPGTVWGPAWVAWTYSEDYLGWAPLPPRDRWRRHDEAAMLLDEPRFQHYWVFVRPHDFMSRHVGRHVQPPYLTETIIHRTRPTGGWRYEGSRIVNRGIPVHEVERLGGGHVEHARTSISHDFSAPAALGAAATAGAITILLPRVWGRAERGAPPPGLRAPGASFGRHGDAARQRGGSHPTAAAGGPAGPVQHKPSGATPPAVPSGAPAAPEAGNRTGHTPGTHPADRTGAPAAAVTRTPTANPKPPALPTGPAQPAAAPAASAAPAPPAPAIHGQPGAHPAASHPQQPAAVATPAAPRVINRLPAAAPAATPGKPAAPQDGSRRHKDEQTPAR